MNEVINALARDEGESVVVTWRRPASMDAEGGDEFSTTLTTGVYKEQNLATELHDQVGYISLKQLTQQSADLVEKAVSDLEEQGALSFVLDIRSNPGGYLTQAVDIASLFMRSGVVVEIETVRESPSTKAVANSTTVTDKPLVVLVDGNTAAAAEVLTAALQDSQRATVVGTTTMGKGSVQRVQKLSFGGALRYTAAYYKTPLGRDINDVGIAPDITVDSDGDEETDNQKQFAIETAQSLVEL